MTETLGARLRQHRERRGMTIAAIAEQTKIKTALLDGLERDDISQWPPGIFRRAYVKAYAVAIGYDADAAVREFLSLHPEPVEAIEPPAPPRGLRGLVASALGSLRKPLNVEPTTGEVVAEPVIPAVPAVASVSTPPENDAPLPRLTPAELLAIAKICTELGRVEDSGQVLPLLREASKVLAARGLIVWVWDATGEVLRPAIVHGYPSKVRARLRPVRADADNVTAASFRASATLAVDGHDRAEGALAVPLLAPAGCIGVLAMELPDGLEQDPTVRATATFIAAMLAQLVGTSTEAESAPAPALSALEAQPG